MTKVTPTADRKADHIRVNLEEDVQSRLTTGLDKIQFEHNALPELKLSAIDTSLTFLGKRLRAPILISSMTGGTARAEAINLTLARGAQSEGVAMGLGSLRAAVEDDSLAKTFQVRRVAPDILLFANLGAVQLNYGYGIDQCRRAVEMIEADALFLHFNALQEALQPEGDTDFESLLPKIENVCRHLGVPVLAKEVGWGISGRTARMLIDAGVAGIDVAGAGGTSWSQVEMYRAQNKRQAKLAGAFIDWGIPTATAVRQVRSELPEIPLIASGGIRSGIDMAKCFALGADLAGMASPFLKAADLSDDELVAVIQDTRYEIRACMFATGSADLPALRSAPLIDLP